jgi:hypothetical protein
VSDTHKLLTTLDVGAKFDLQFREFSYDIQGKKTLPVTDNGLLSVDLKGGYNFNPGSKQIPSLMLQGLHHQQFSILLSIFNIFLVHLNSSPLIFHRVNENVAFTKI